ncbi:MAG: HD domain-containing protein [Deltaproteobacteria bacterium]
MLSAGIIKKIYESASIYRWNDLPRPFDFTELDKQAHKMIIAYVLAKFEESEKGININWTDLIEGAIFEFFHRIILTDIKPPVFHKMMAEKGEKLNSWVLERLKSDIRDLPGDFEIKFEKYLSDPDYSKLEKRILGAAHYLATSWEFNLIYNTAPFLYGIEKTKEDIENKIEDYYELAGVQKISLKKKTYGFIDICGQLRFQRRWAQSPRVPETSVLGHMFIVAVLSYFMSNELGACNKRIYNNFFAGLFHDLPEVLTRDIVSPIKRSVKGLEEIIKEYEDMQMEERIMPLLSDDMQKEINYFIKDEFDNKVLKEGMPEKVERIGEELNKEEFSPVDGKMIRVCDHLAAFMEAVLSINHGISSYHLEDGKEHLFKLYQDMVFEGIDIGVLYRELYKMN